MYLIVHLIYLLPLLPEIGVINLWSMNNGRAQRFENNAIERQDSRKSLESSMEESRRSENGY